MYLDNFKVEDMQYILTKETTLSRYYVLIPISNEIITKLIDYGIVYKDQYDEIYNTSVQKLQQIIGMEQSVIEQFHSLLHLHDFRNRKLNEISSIDSNFMKSIMSQGMIKSLDIIELSKTDKSSNSNIVKQENFNKLLHICHLMRLPGVKDIRASLYYDSGICGLDEFKKLTYDEVYNRIQAFIKESGTNKTMPLRKELMTQIAVSIILP